MLKADSKSETELKTRIDMSKETFNNKKLFCIGMDLEMKRRLV